MYLLLEHPEIEWALRTGYPSWMQGGLEDGDEDDYCDEYPDDDWEDDYDEDE